MKKIIADLHTHSLASGHAYGTIREMVAAAQEKGLQMLGITEHAPGIPGTCHEFYFGNLNAVPRQFGDLQLRLGSEINVLNDGSLSLKERQIQRIDYGIAGIHTLCYENEGKEKNTDNLISCMKHERIFFVSHPDDDNTPLNYERLVQASLDYHVALELNNSSLMNPKRRLNCVENYKTMLALCEKLHAPIIVSSDAHDPSMVANHSFALKFLEEIDFPDELVLNNDLEKVQKFLGEK